MNQPLRVTEEQIAAAQLRIVLDEKLGRQTPDVVGEIAAATVHISPEQQAHPGMTFDKADPGAFHQHVVTESSPNDDFIEVRRRLEAHSDWPLQARHEALKALDQSTRRIREAWKLLLDASDANNRGEHAQAERILQQATHIFHTAAERSEKVSQAGLAETYNYLGQHRRELAAYDSYLRGFPNEDDDSRVQATALLNRSSVLMKVDRVKDAFTDTRKALELLREAGDRDGEAAALTHLGKIAERLGQHEEALESEQQANEIRQRLRAPEEHEQDQPPPLE